MKVAILLNRDKAHLRTLAKQVLTAGYQVAHGDFSHLGGVVLPEYDSFARVLDPKPLVLGTDGRVDWKSLEGYELLIWEWGWTDVPPRTVMDIRRHLDIPTLMFPGPIDRFWREVDACDLRMQFQIAQCTDMVGVMLRDTIGFYQDLLPDAHVFHMPVPVEVDDFKSFALDPSQKDRKTVLLTAPTLFSGTASQLPIATHLAFRRLLARKADLKGICFAYQGEEIKQAKEVFDLLGVAASVELAPFVRPLFRYFERINPCYAGLYLPHGLIQGRTALISACLGIPMVVSDEVETHTSLYPFSHVKWYDTQGAADLCLRLLEDREFFDKVRREAFERVQYYSVEECRKRMFEGIRQGVERRKGRTHSP